MRWYQSHAIMCHFTACEIIIKRNLTSVCRINDIQWWNNCGKWNLNGLVNIVRARVVIIKWLLRNKVYWTVILCYAVHWQFNGAMNCLSALSITDEHLWLLPFAWRSFHDWEWNSMLSWGTKLNTCWNKYANASSTLCG